MTRPPARWLDSELPEPLSRVLASASPDPADHAALDRMRARLGEALGPGFQTGTRTASPTHSSVGSVVSWSRAAWLGLATIVALGLVASWRAWTPEPVPTSTKLAAEQPLQPPAAAPLALEREVARMEPVTEPAARPPSAAAPGGAAPRVDRGLAEELRQLEHARRLLHTSPQRALAAVRTQSQRFSQGALGAERDLLRIDALLRLGRAEQAQRLAERVLGVPDPHPYRVQIEALLSGSPSAAAR
jgi:hypothetical protein